MPKLRKRKTRANREFHKQVLREIKHNELKAKDPDYDAKLDIVAKVSRVQLERIKSEKSEQSNKKLSVVINRLVEERKLDLDIKDDLINKLVETKKSDIGFSQDYNVEHQENETEFLTRSDVDDSRDKEYTSGEEKLKTEVRKLPVASSHKMKMFLASMKQKPKKSKYEEDIRKCLSHMNPAVPSFWNTPSTVLRAIKHSLLHRQWNNLPHLLIMLIHQDQRSTLRNHILHICDIMDKLHPVIKANGLQGQFHHIRRGANSKLDAI